MYRSEDIIIPPKYIVLRKDPFDPFEADYYQSVYTQSQTQFNAYVSSGTVLNNYAHIFDLLIRLRQAVNHPYLVQYSEKNYLQQRKDGASAGVRIRTFVPVQAKIYVLDQYTSTNTDANTAPLQPAWYVGYARTSARIG